MILITGSKGQLGRNIQQAAAKSFPHFSFVCADVDELDITQAAAVHNFCTQHQPKFIINCAAYTAVDKAEDETEKAAVVNTDAVMNLTEAAASINAFLLHISTDYVFDGNTNMPYTEKDAVNPLSVYGKTKLAGEHAALAYARSMVVRTAWLYAAEGNNFVNTMLRLGNERTSVNVVNDQYGSPTYAYDLAKTLLKIVDKVNKNPAAFHSGIYHFTNEGTCSWFDFAKKIMELGQCNCIVNPVNSAAYPTAAHRPKYSALSKEKIKQTYGIRIASWEDGLIRCFKQKNSNQ